MPQAEFDTLVLGSGQGGKLLAWHLARSGQLTAVVERRWIGGSCPNSACLPSKKEIWSTKVAQLVHHAAQFGTTTGRVGIDMAKARQRKRDMAAREVAFYLKCFETSGAELIMGSGLRPTEECKTPSRLIPSRHEARPHDWRRAGDQSARQPASSNMPPCPAASIGLMPSGSHRAAPRAGGRPPAGEEHHSK